MARVRKQEYCRKCGEPYRAIFRDREDMFFGDNFVRWDKSGHVCSFSFVDWVFSLFGAKVQKDPKRKYIITNKEHGTIEIDFKELIKTPEFQSQIEELQQSELYKQIKNGKNN